jgi:hypothetical protein
MFHEEIGWVRDAGLYSSVDVPILHKDWLEWRVFAFIRIPQSQAYGSEPFIFLTYIFGN